MSTPPKPPTTTSELEGLQDLLGRELALDEVARRLRSWVQSRRARVIGALHVSCADEAELECRDAFKRGFVRYMLPSFKFSTQAAMECSNLGARYEWGAAGLVDNHFGLARGAEQGKLLVLKINAHVSVHDDAGSPSFGQMKRYDADSTYCGMLHALIEGRDLPAADELEETFAMEGLDRLAALRDPAQVDPRHAGLFAAVTCARLQARRAIIEIQDLTPETPTQWLVVPCVSLNRRAHDTEIVVGTYLIDRREPGGVDHYWGLGDDPASYRLELDARDGNSLNHIAITDGSLFRPRPARDHRALVVETWNAGGEPEAAAAHPRAQELEQIASDAGGVSQSVAKATLGTLLALAFEVSPIPAALLLFSQGALGVHHAERAHRLAHRAAGDDVARQMLADVHERVNSLEPEHAANLARLLGDKYKA